MKTDRGDGFQCTEDGRGGGASVLDADVEHGHGDDGRHDGHHADPAKGRPARDGHEVTARHAERIDSDNDRRKHHDVEGHLEGRHGDVRAVHHDDINGVGERGDQHENDAPKRHLRFAVSLIEQQYSNDTQHDGENHHHRSLFLEEDRHDDRHHHRIGEQDGGGDPGIEVLERGVKRQRGGRKQHAQREQDLELVFRDLERHFLH